MTTKSIGATGRDYSTLQSWEDACPANLVTSTQTWEGECYNDAEFTAAGAVCTIAGTTTDATYFITLRCATGQSFRDHASVRSNALFYSQANGVAVRTTGAYTAAAIDSTVPYTVIKDLQIRGATGVGARFGIGSATGDNQTVSGCLIRAHPPISAGSGGGQDNHKVHNCVLISDSASQVGIATVGATAEIVGCTIVETAATPTVAGITVAASSTILIQNTAVFGFNAFYTGAATATSGSGANCTDYSSSFGTTYTNYNSSTFSSEVVSTTTDFRAKTGGNLEAHGTYNALVDPDISKYTRHATTPTIGCWELAAAGGSSVVPIIDRQFRARWAA